MWSQRAHTGRVLTAVLLVVVAAGIAPTVAAQEGPSVTVAGADIQVDAGETSAVSATYEFQVASVGSGDSALSSVSGTLWEFPGRSISGIATAVNGQSVEPQVSESAQHTTLAVPVEGVSDGDTVTVTVEYQVAGPAGDLRVPIWVPEYNTAGQERVVSMTVTLPDGTQSQGDPFPNVQERRDGGNTLVYSMLHVPGFVSTSYGTEGPGLLTINGLSSLLGIVFILAFFGVWVYGTRRRAAALRGESDVA